ncbi:MAG: ester cyclase [Anaerolineaceae bacterium]|nr:ester cyclase [Anaerolineaceae bacterium]
MSEQDNIKIARSFFDAWNSGDLSRSAPYEASDMKIEAPGAPASLDREQNRKYNQNFLTAFPGSKFEVMLIVAQGDYVVQNWTITGKNTGPMQSPSGNMIAPTGKVVTLSGSSTTQIKNGKIVHGWTYWDMASFLTQLGLLPPM